MSRRRKILLGTLTIFLATFLSLLVVENLIEFYIDHQRERARSQLDYGDVSHSGGAAGDGFSLLEGFSAPVRDGYGGTVQWTNNSQGFRHEKEFESHPPEGTIRILSLGDSFTAGYRVDQFDTFSRRLEEWSTTELFPAEVLISLAPAPSLGLQYLVEEGFGWNPHIVLLGLTLGNDIAHSYIALHPQAITFDDLRSHDIPDDALLAGQREWPPEWLQRRNLYHFIIEKQLLGEGDAIATSNNDAIKPKLFDGVHGLGIFLRNPPVEIDIAYQRLFEILRETEAVCRSRGIPFAVLVFPQRFQVQPEDWRATVIEYHLRGDRFDLMRPNRLIRDFCDRNSIECIDPTTYMLEYHERTGKNLYLPNGDMHWNREGHRVWLDGAKPYLEELIRQAHLSRRRD